MKEQRTIDKLISDYFEKEKQQTNSDRLKAKILAQTVDKKNFRIRRLVIPVAATILLVLGISVWTWKQVQRSKTNNQQTEVLYEDDDLIIYVQEVDTDK